VVEVKALNEGGISIRHTDPHILPDLVVLTEDEAREVFQWLYDHFENLDRETLAKWLTNDKRP
jgi:hypothetical protein